MPVRNIVKSYYTTDDVVTLAKNILAKARTLDPANATVTALSGSLSTAYQTLLSSLTRTKQNTQTELLAEADLSGQPPGVYMLLLVYPDQVLTHSLATQ